MEKNKVRYFNFPIQLLQGFMKDSEGCLHQICNYAIYAHSLNLEYGEDPLELMQSAANFYQVRFISLVGSFHNGKMLFETIEKNSPMVGLNLSIFWDFMNNEKSEFEKVTLLGFLAIKSIIGNKAYCKVTNNYWLSRMDGKTKSVKDKFELTEEIRKYSTEYQIKKIKAQLHLKWGLIDYSRYMRGFYVSFKLSMEQLVFEAEKRREKNQEKLYKQRQKEALECALRRLGK